MFNKIQIFQNEINSILVEIERLPGRLLADTSLEDRVRQLFVTWHTTLKPVVASTGVQPDLIEQLDSQLELIARNTGKRISKSVYKRQLKNVSKVLNLIYIYVVRVTSPFAISSPEAGRRVLEEIPDLPDEFIPNALLGWKSKIKDYLKKYPFEQNVFIMIRYASASTSLLNVIESAVKNVEIDGRRMHPVVAKDHKITDDLNNPIACLLSCRYGIAVFDSISNRQNFNPNVSYELGMMHFLKRECLILKDDKLKTMPSDILHKIYESYSKARDAEDKIEKWLQNIVK